MTTTRANTKTSETEALRADLEMTRQHLADTVQELTRQLNVPRRIKDSAADARHRAVQAAGHAAQRAKETAGDVGHRAKETAEVVGHRAMETAEVVGHRAKETAGVVGHRAKEKAGSVGHRAKDVTGGATEAKHLPEGSQGGVMAKAKQVPELAKRVPELSRKHPRAAAAVGGAVVLGAGATAWIVGRK